MGKDGKKSMMVEGKKGFWRRRGGFTCADSGQQSEHGVRWSG